MTPGKPLPRVTGEDLNGCGEGGFHRIGTTSPQADKGTASWYVRAVPCFGVFRPSSLPALAWLAAGEITADKISMSAEDLVSAASTAPVDPAISCARPSEEEVQRALNRLKNGKAPGICNVPPELLKYGIRIA